MGDLDPAADLAAVRRVLAGKEGAVDDLIDRLACLPAMIRVKHRRMGAPLQVSELEDVVQTVLLALWQKLAQYDGRVPVVFWASGFGTLEIRKSIERRSRRREQQPLDSDPASEPRECTVDRERLMALVLEIDQPDRDIVTRKNFEGLTFEELSAATGLPVNTVKTKYYRALERLRVRLRGQGEEEER